MASLSDHSSNEIIKGLIMGDPGSGKTGGLTSLVKAGYKLRIYDFDNLLGSLVSFVRRECPDKIGNVSFQTFTDKLKSADTPLVMIGGAMSVMPNTDGTPTAYIQGLKQLDNWKVLGPNKEVLEDFGKPATWGPDTVVVIDSLTSFSMAAFRYVKAMNPMAKEPQAQYFAAQQLVMNMLYLLGQESFKTNVLVLAHIDYKDNHLNLTKGFPRSVGSALNSQIAAVFNCVLLTESLNGKRLIKTESTGIVDLKNPVSFKLPKDGLPLETGLATFFEAVLKQ